MATSRDAEKNDAEALSILDRAFTLFFLVTSILIVPSVNSILAAGQNAQSGGNLLSGYLFSSIIGSIMIVVAVYGLAILLKVRWLRLAGIYGLFCIFIKAWLILFTWLSTSPANYGLFADPAINSIAYFACLFIAPLAFYGWQKRNDVQIERSTYYSGIIASYDLFLVFSFLLHFVVWDFAGRLSWAFLGLSLISVSGVVVIFPMFMKKKFGLSKSANLILIINFVWFEAWASTVLLFPTISGALDVKVWSFIFGPLFWIGTTACIIIDIILTVKFGRKARREVHALKQVHDFHH